MRSPAGQEALRSFNEAQDAGLSALGKGGAADTVGTVKPFNVLTNLLFRDANEWVSLDFRLRATGDVANVWVADTLSDTFDEANLAAIEEYILNSTPEHSFRQDRGIVENDNEVFGDPPAITDTDGVLDVLFHDIYEGDGRSCCVLGYFSPVDQNPYSGPGEGNRGNVLYVDLPDGMNSGGIPAIAGTIAHEYQHLIHFAYISPSKPELTFVNEGFSEWAEVINGFFLRNISYLNSPAEHEVALFDWRRNSSTTVLDKDYQRAGLLTTYIADRIGREATGRIVQAKGPDGKFAIGAAGYDIVLNENDLTFAQLVADFHAANFINDRSFGEAFGYSLEQRQAVSAVPTESVQGLIQASPSEHHASIRHGAFRYLTWTNVNDLHLQIADGIDAGSTNRSLGALRLFTESTNGVAELIDLDVETQEYLAEGDFDRVTLIISHVKPSDPDLSPPSMDLDVTATWEGGASHSEASVAYDDGANSDTLFFGLSEEDMQANAFDVPANGTLSSVFVAPVYLNQFSTASGDPYLPDGLPRNFRLKIWADDGSGLPGDEIYSDALDSGANTSHINYTTFAYSFLEIGLPDSEPALQNLPERIFVGVANEGDDDNILVLAPAGSTSGDSHSVIYRNGAWSPLAEFDSRLEGHVLPIRATFLVATANEATDELPTAIALDRNYPNPFNPATTIAYSLPRSMQVRLAVYNVLGQRVATLVDGLQHAGSHALRVDATAWASGVYVYALETETQILTQRMVVLK